MLFIIIAIIALVIAAHWAISRTKLYPLGLLTPLAWIIGVSICMIRDHSLFDARGIAAGLGGAAFLFGVWASGVERYKKSHGGSGE